MMSVKFWKKMLIACVIPAVLLLPGCAGDRPLPDDARAALLEYWDSLPSEVGLEHHIIRSWPGEPPSGGEVEIEVWCVEAEMAAADNPQIDGEVLTWLLFRQGGAPDWSAALLMSMSATWPYESCGQAPGSR